MLKYIPSGDSALIIKAGDDISENTSRIIRKLLATIGKVKIEGIVDFIPSFNELMICFNPLLTDSVMIRNRIKSVESEIESVVLPESRLIYVPVLYGGEYGPDLDVVSAYCKITPEDVIRIHSASQYLIYMIGFTPGFCYLGGMDNRIAVPRKKDPRLRIPPGSVGIADIQTGIYSVESPGGWQIIGITPLRLFDPAGKPEFLFMAGDRIKFEPVTKTEFDNISADILKGTYTLRTG